MPRRKQIQFEWYVLNEVNHKSKFDNDYHYYGKIKPWNIFENWLVNEETISLCMRYKRKKMTLEEFTEELRGIIAWQEWARCEYEILVTPLFGKEESLQKIDCYSQVLPNINILAKYVLKTYYPRLVI